VDGAHRIVLPAGSYIQPDLLLEEIESLSLSPDIIAISPHARLITPEHMLEEAASGIAGLIGSTTTGTGSAVISALRRRSLALGPLAVFANQDDRLSRYIQPTTDILREALDEGRRVIIEGTQGFGLSAFHSSHWPNVTSRDTTASAFVAEAGLSPLDVDDVTIVIRAWPIRVAGNSGRLEEECNWETVTDESGSPEEVREFTSVTKRLRRVGRFEFDIVRQAIAVNCPTRLVLNHLDHIDWKCRGSSLTGRAWEFIHYVERGLARHVDWVGTGVDEIVDVRQRIPLRA
jgi:adenylosuccinate synthase